MEEEEEVQKLLYLESATASIANVDCVQLTRRINRKFDSKRRHLGGEITMSGPITVKRRGKSITGCATGLERCAGCSNVFIPGVNMKVRANRGGVVIWECLKCKCSIKAVVDLAARKKSVPPESASRPREEGGGPSTKKKKIRGLSSLLKAKREKSQEVQNPALGYFLKG